MVQNIATPDWDDLRYCLAVWRCGSVRKAAAILGVTHTTVSRRVAATEETLGIRLFDKLPTGYHPTSGGEDVLKVAERMEENAEELQRLAFGRDRALKGSLRVTLPAVLASNLLMPELADFASRFPEIELELLTSYETMNMSKRDADVALRLARTPQALPGHLIGRRLAEVHFSVYRARNGDRGRDAPAKWILKEEDGALQSWAEEMFEPAGAPPILVNDLSVQIAAVRQGLGYAVLPCFVGDSDPVLSRAGGRRSVKHGDLWILMHKDLRHVPRIRAFVDFITGAITGKVRILHGEA